MKGLILKDLMTLKKTFKSYFILFAVYLVIDMMSDQSSLTFSISVIIATMIPVATISYDERNKWDKFVNTMPFSRREIVFSKYMLGIGLLAATLVVTFVCNRLSFADRVATTVAMGLVCLLYQALLIPVLIKFGSEKGRIIMMIVMLLPIVAFTVLSKLVDFEGMKTGAFLDKNIFVISAVIISVTILLYRRSVMTSVKIYSEKEF